MSAVPRIAVTCGEPAGIGYDLVAAAAYREWDAELIAIGDPDLLRTRSDRVTPCVAPLVTHHWEAECAPRAPSRPGEILVDPIPLARNAEAGRLDAANARAVVDSLERAVRLAVSGSVDAIVTAPVHKGIINEAGIPFSGHTELLAELTATATPVMMLVAGDLRVALATTHLPLRDVPAAITPERLEAVITALHHDLVDKFAIAAPHIQITGLNPHAGEGGHLGDEEQTIVEPVVQRLRDSGLHLTGPVPADTAFTPRSLQGIDATLAMYHDQGLPVLKHAGFGRAVNVTLGLPIIRTSVDHGTALDLAGTGEADGGSLQAAIELAADLARRRQHAGN